jgi:hypothetical protein
MPDIVVDTSNALDLHDANNTSPVGGQSPGFLAWLAANYSDVIAGGQGIACLIDPKRCNNSGVGGETVVVQDNSSKIYFLILGLFLIIILVILLLKK